VRFSFIADDRPLYLVSGGGSIEQVVGQFENQKRFLCETLRPAWRPLRFGFVFHVFPQSPQRDSQRNAKAN
jgi:hypothetical protein